MGLRGFHLLFSLHHFVAGYCAGGLGGFLEAVEGGLRGSELGFRLGTFGLNGLSFGFGFGDLRFHFGGAQFYQKVALLDVTAAVYQHALHVPGHLGVE